MEHSPEIGPAKFFLNLFHENDTVPSNNVINVTCFVFYALPKYQPFRISEQNFSVPGISTRFSSGAQNICLS